jgi:flagellar motility protein MotE (MotC chaperone)
MIVTRQRRKPFPWRRLILPVVAIALVAFALVWQPSRNFIANGPLAPVWRATGPAAAAIAEPFHSAAQNEIITERNAQIVQLQNQLAALQKQADAKDKRIANLKSQVQQMQLQASQQASQPTAAPAGSSNAAPAAAAGATGFANGASAGNDLAANATPDERRTAQYWANMEPGNAAKVIQKLPIDYSARILALMSPDAVGSILDALPTAYAAKLTQDHPELRK